MSNDNSTEEKTLPPSHRKLQEARRKGQVSHSQDLVNAAVVIVAVIYLWTQWTSIEQRLLRMLSLPTGVEREEFGDAARMLAAQLIQESAIILLPVVVLAVLAVLIANILVKKGVVVATEPIKPRAERLSPVTGLKQLFSLRSLVNLVKSLCKVAILLAGLSLVILFGLDALLGAPACGLSCVLATGGGVIKQFVAIAAGVFVVAGLIDIGLQQWLFLRDMRMTKTEMKRELKELEGDPLIRRQRRRRRQEVLAGSTRLGPDQATFFVGRPGAVAVGVRYVRGETPAPVVVCKGTGESADEMLALARQKGLPIESNPRLVDRIAGPCRIGAVVPESLYDAIADIIVRNKLA
jgi:type III secretion protein U